MVEVTIDSLNGSSLCLNGTSLEDIKELTLNMRVPHSQSMKTKTEAEAKQLNFRQGASCTELIESVAAHEGSLEPHLVIDEIDEGDEDLESNYITTGSYTQGIPSRNRGMLD